MYSALVEVIVKRCLALQHTTTTMECTSHDKLFWSAVNRIVIQFHTPAWRVTIFIQVSVCYPWITSRVHNYVLLIILIPSECMALGLLVFSNIIYSFLTTFLIILVLVCIIITRCTPAKMHVSLAYMKLPLCKYRCIHVLSDWWVKICISMQF